MLSRRVMSYLTISPINGFVSCQKAEELSHQSQEERTSFEVGRLRFL